MTAKRMLKVGDKVRLRRGDDHFDMKYDGRVGTVKKVVMEGLDIGECRHDPAYMVAVRFIGTDAFWGEELRRVPDTAKNRQVKKITRRTFWCDGCGGPVTVYRPRGNWKIDPICMECTNPLIGE